MFNIVLLEPEIPANTGNIGRTCVATGCTLHLIKPLGFSMEDKYLRRSGLDYWQDLDVRVYECFDDFMKVAGDTPLFMASTKSSICYADAVYPEGCYLIFGKETKGLPEELLLTPGHTNIRIPMLSDRRSLNLANSVAVILYEAFRQHSYAGLEQKGRFSDG